MFRTLITILIVFIIIFCIYSILPTLYFKVFKYNPKNIQRKHKYLCLTFDDGPSDIYTEKIVDLLNKYNVKSTFFMVADFAIANPEVVKKIIKSGHSIGLHSQKHHNALIQTPYDAINDFKQSMKIFKNLNIDIKYCRPPWGHVNLLTILMSKIYNLKMVFWNVMAEDWLSDTTPDIIQNKLLKRVKNGSIICLHDGRGKNHAPIRTLEALEKVIPIWLKESYEFIGVEKLYER
ncbi:polysaccharide deacetylase family protein [Sedimentibacter sp. zth1]|uniref:polysaccharide deacetylase family protein n=1 Tax=Sedimentibacter sp. zth1 TaxID=2816908 RepID=UPI001A912899|nr:polysaccharide deacetylase family protein [Sedimentibacter sp. zth1]QSX05870.1 polysaccharide deacetylase family protein [Sedimentibacter sp. zth1]